MQDKLYEFLEFEEEYLDYLFKIHKENFEKYFVVHYGKWDDKRQYKSFKKMVSSGNYKMIKFKGQVVGMINYQPGINFKEALIYNLKAKEEDKKPPAEMVSPAIFRYLNIDKNYQGKSIGTLILRDIVRECKDYAITLKVYRENLLAQQLYKRLGFTEDNSASDNTFISMHYTKSAKITGYRNWHIEKQKYIEEEQQ